MENVVRLVTILKPANKPEAGGFDPSHLLRDVIALKPSQGLTPAHNPQGAL